MKKVILTILLAIVGCVAAIAGDEIKLSSGSVATLKDGGTGCVVLDIAKAKFDNKKPLKQDERFANVGSQIPECTKEFIREFNEKAKKFKMTDKAKEAKYLFTVKITNVDTYVNVMSFKGGVGIKLWGSVTIKEKATNKEIAVYTIDEEDNSGFTYQIALEEAFEGIAKFLAKRINKGK